MCSTYHHLLNVLSDKFTGIAAVLLQAERYNQKLSCYKLTLGNGKLK